MSISARKLPNIVSRFAGAMALCIALLWLNGCNTQQPSDEQLRKQAQQATEQAKKNAREAAAVAKTAAANAERKVNDIAAGVKDGLQNGKPAAMQVDINSASESQLAGLPGISEARARRIIRGRPYSTSDELVSKGILTREQFERISAQITAK
jgi:DNA uptake protein ComE-like DNA-binding protein